MKLIQGLLLVLISLISKVNVNAICTSTSTSDVINMLTSGKQFASWLEGGYTTADERSWVSISTTYSSFVSAQVFISLPEISGETSSEGYPAIARLRNVVSSGQVSFETRIYLANDSFCVKTWYTPEHISPALKLSWLVVENGAWNVSGTYLFVGSGEINRTDSNVLNSDNFFKISYPTGCGSSTTVCAFTDSTKIGVIMQLQTLVNDRLIIPRGVGQALRFARYVLQPHDALDLSYYTIATETMAYMAFETGASVSCVEGLSFETRKFTGVTNVKFGIDFTYSYDVVPGVFGAIGTSTSLTDSTGLRVFDRTRIGANVITQEDQCVDEETDHTTGETAFAFVVGTQFDLPSCVICNVLFYRETNSPTGVPSSVPTVTYSPSSSYPSGQPSLQPSFTRTGSPSGSPSNQPSTFPSSEPSSLPTDSPTPEPSNIPTGIPSSDPSSNPSGVPSALPSSLPSSVPTGIPSVNPTGIPSSIPSSEPTSSPLTPTVSPSSSEPTISPYPTCTPSEEPSGQPSSVPSGVPSSIPSGVPTISQMPSLIPSSSPSTIPSSYSPTTTPTDHPTEVPTAIPTEAPTTTPTDSPTESPTDSPTLRPTAQPSDIPTFLPSDIPSVLPTTDPSEKPSSIPTENPSGIPTSTPSCIPTETPTEFPTTQPTEIPTSLPSTIPTVNPSAQPSCFPSSYPSSSPTSSPSSFVPSIEPTSLPSSLPTVIPSFRPSRPPSSEPTSQPTNAPSKIPTSSPTSKPSVSPTRLGETFSPSSTPTSTPSSRPSSRPSVIPTLIGDTNPPTSSPTSMPTSIPSVAPTFAPTTVNATNSPTFSPTLHPTSLPSFNPTIAPTRKPSINPSRVPSSNPSRPGDTNMPSSNPTVRPTTSPSSKPTTHTPTFSPTISPTAAKTVPITSLVSVTADGNNVAVITNATSGVYGGIYYCGVFEKISAFISLNSIRSQGHMVSIPFGDSSVNSYSTVVLEFENLAPQTTYHLYCFAEDTLGNVPSYSSVLSSGQTFNTTGYKKVYFLDTPSILFSDQSSYESLSQTELFARSIRFALDYAPDESLSVTVKFTFLNGTQTDKVYASTSTFEFTSSSLKLDSSFWVYGDIGNYTMTFSLGGASLSEFEFESTHITIADIDNLPSPSISSVIFSSNGLQLFVQFDSPTDFASSVLDASLNWNCSLLFDFHQASSSTCIWLSSNSILVTLSLDDSKPMLNVNSSFTLLGNKIKASCVSCSEYSSSHVVAVQAPQTVITPNVVIIMPSYHTLFCSSNMTIDTSLSTGGLGRAWADAEWRVISADANTSKLENWLNNHHKFSISFEIPSHLLEEVGTYVFSYGVRNFLQDSSKSFIFSSQTVKFVNDSDTFSVSIDSSTNIVLYQKSELRLSSSASLYSCDASNFVTGIDVLYSWSIFLHTANDILGTSGISSSSSDPSQLYIPSSSFKAGNTYTLSVTASYETYSDTKSVQVYIMHANLYAFINGISSNTFQSALSSDSISLSGEDSYDVDTTSNENLYYSWSCVYVSVQDFGSSCLNLCNIDGFLLNINSSTLEVSKVYKITLTVSSNDNSILRTASVSSTFEVLDSTSDSLTISFENLPLPGGFNVDEVLSVDGILSANTLNQVVSYYSLTSMNEDSSVSLSQLSTIGSTARNFTSAQVEAGATFPIAFNPNSLYPGVPYVFRLTASLAGSKHFSEFSIVSSSPPIGGVFKSNPSEGFEFSTKFKLYCSRWEGVSVSDYPLSYVFAYQLSEKWDKRSVYQTASLKSTKTFTSNIFPSGVGSSSIISTRARISSNVGATTTVYSSLKVLPLTPYDYDISSSRRLSKSVAELDYILYTVLDDALESVSHSFTASSLVNSIQTSIDLMNILYQPNCSLVSAETCASKNRQVCSMTTQTCGACLDGFVGIYGDSNQPCTSPNSSDIGDACVTDKDCLSGTCKNDVCIIPLKSCPLDSNGFSCSNHGNCTFKTVNNGEISTCDGNNPDCVAFCTCDDNYFGHDCSRSEESQSLYNSHINDLCTFVATSAKFFDDSVEKLNLYTNFISNLFEVRFISDMDTLSSCATTLDVLTAILSNNDDVSLFNADNSVQNLIVELMSNFVKSEYYSVATSSLTNLVNSFSENMLTNMVPGQEDIILTSDNLQIAFQYQYLNFYENANLVAPISDQAYFYGAVASEISLPATGLANCEYYDEFAKMALISWVESPYQRYSNLTSHLFTVQSFATSSSSTVTTSEEFYNLTLRFTEEKTWDDEHQPDCYLLSAEDGKFSKCDSCEISTYSSLSVTFTCSDFTQICPASALSTSRKLSSDSPDFFVAIDSKITVNSFKSYTALNTRSVGALSAVSVLFFLFLVGLIFFRFWDHRDRKIFIYERNEDLKRGKQFDLSSAFDEGGKGFHPFGTNLFSAKNRNEQSVMTTPNQNQALVLPSEEEEFRLNDENSEEIPVTSFLSSKSLFSHFFSKLMRHHRWIRMLTYPSIQLPRYIRYLVTCSDILTIVFTTTIFFNIYYFDDKSCQDYNESPSECLNYQRPKFNTDTSYCDYNKYTGECSLNAPHLSLFFTGVVAVIVVFFSILPRRFLQFLLESICAKRPIMEDIDYTSGWWLWDEPQTLPTDSPKSKSGETKDDSFKQSTPVKSDSVVLYGENGDSSEIVEDIPYKLSYCDTISPQEELNVIIATTKEFFSSTLEVVPIPWRENQENELNEGAKQLGLMGSIMLWMGVHADGTPVPLTFLQKLIYQTPLNRLGKLIEKYRKTAVAIYRKTTEEYYAAPGQSDWKNQILIQHFIYEQLAPLTRFALSKDLYYLDSASSGRVGLFLWLFVWFGLFIAYGGMISWVISWCALFARRAANAWGIVLIIVFLTDIFLNELSQVWFIHTIVVEKLRPQLKQIYNVLRKVWAMHITDRLPPSDDLRLVQHISSSCRAARFESITKLMSSKILRSLDDNDIALCRNQRLESIFEIGFFAYWLLWFPSFFNELHPVIATTALDMIIPIFWFCFFILNHVIALFSPFLLGALYIFWAIMLIAWYVFMQSQYYDEHLRLKEPIDNLARDTNKFGTSKSDKFLSQQDAQWKMINIADKNASSRALEAHSRFDDIRFTWNESDEQTNNESDDNKALVLTTSPVDDNNDVNLGNDPTNDLRDVTIVEADRNQL